MNTAGLLDRFRSDQRDLASPYLWSDIDIYSYIDDAQNMFCRLTGGIADSTSNATQALVTAGLAYANVSPKILKVRYASLRSTGKELGILNFEDLQFGKMEREDYGLQVVNGLTNVTGTVTAIVTGMEDNKIRLVKVPAANDVVDLIISRLPLAEVTGSQDLEIDLQHHTHLLLWMKRCAYMKDDAETYDRGRAETYESAFNEYCNRAKAERERREHKHRTVAYGGY